METGAYADVQNMKEEGIIDEIEPTTSPTVSEEGITAMHKPDE